MKIMKINKFILRADINAIYKSFTYIIYLKTHSLYEMFFQNKYRYIRKKKEYKMCVSLNIMLAYIYCASIFNFIFYLLHPIYIINDK